MIDSPAEEDKMMWDYCTPGPEALHKEVTLRMIFILIYDQNSPQGGHHQDDCHSD